MLSGLKQRRVLCNLARELIQGQQEYRLNRVTLACESGISQACVDRTFVSEDDLRLSIAETELYSHFKHLEYSCRLHNQSAKALLYHACWIVYETQVMGRFSLHKLVSDEALIFGGSSETSRRYLRSLANYNDYLAYLLKTLISPKLTEVVDIYKWMANDHLLQDKSRSLEALNGYAVLVESLAAVLDIEPQGCPSKEELAEWLISEFSAADPYESTLAVGQ